MTLVSFKIGAKSLGNLVGPQAADFAECSHCELAQFTLEVEVVVSLLGVLVGCCGPVTSSAEAKVVVIAGER